MCRGGARANELAARLVGSGHCVDAPRGPATMPAAAPDALALPRLRMRADLAAVRE